jgi:hypothetical protein
MGIDGTFHDYTADYTPEKPKLRTGAELANQFGINIDEDAIKAKLNAATAAQYTDLRREFRNTENTFLRSMYEGGNSMFDAIRRANAGAMASGASRGTTAANILSAMTTQQAGITKGATDLANQRNQLVSKEHADLAKNTVDAMSTANQLKTSLAGLGSDLYGYDVQDAAAMMQYYATLDASERQRWAAKYKADLERGAHWI